METLIFFVFIFSALVLLSSAFWHPAGPVLVLVFGSLAFFLPHYRDALLFVYSLCCALFGANLFFIFPQQSRHESVASFGLICIFYVFIYIWFRLNRRFTISGLLFSALFLIGANELTNNPEIQLILRVSMICLALNFLPLILIKRPGPVKFMQLNQIIFAPWNFPASPFLTRSDLQNSRISAQDWLPNLKDALSLLLRLIPFIAVLSWMMIFLVDPSKGPRSWTSYLLYRIPEPGLFNYAALLPQHYSVGERYWLAVLLLGPKTILAMIYLFAGSVFFAALFGFRVRYPISLDRMSRLSGVIHISFYFFNRALIRGFFPPVKKILNRMNVGTSLSREVIVVFSLLLFGSLTFNFIYDSIGRTSLNSIEWNLRNLFFMIPYYVLLCSLYVFSRVYDRPRPTSGGIFTRLWLLIQCYFWLVLLSLVFSMRQKLLAHVSWEEYLGILRSMFGMSFH